MYLLSHFQRAGAASCMKSSKPTMSRECAPTQAWQAQCTSLVDYSRPCAWPRLRVPCPLMLINVNSAVPWSQVCSGFLLGSDWPWPSLSRRYCPGSLPSLWLLALPIGWRSVAQLLTGWCARFPFSGSRIFLSLPRVSNPCLAVFFF